MSVGIEESADSPIGVFDSGLGGLTVVRALMRVLPAEHVYYLGDTARLPYGTKSLETVAFYALKSARFLLERGAKMLLIACNTASASALALLEQELPVPVLGAVGPGAESAVAATRSGQVGVIGTLTTVHSRAYVRAIAALEPRIDVVQLACPLLVPLAEEGWLGDGDPLEAEAVRAVARRYLGELRRMAPALDVLVLGCTHYPLLAPLLREVTAELWSHPVRLVDSAQAMALAALQRLPQPRPAHTSGVLRCFVTDQARLDDVGGRFLGAALGPVEKVDLK